MIGTPISAGYYQTSSLEDVLLHQNASIITRPDGFGNGWCTDLVRFYRGQEFSGDAKYWYNQAINSDYETGNEPREGAIYITLGGKYGHVAYVDSVSTSSFTVIEQNIVAKYVVSERSIQINNNQLFIY